METASQGVAKNSLSSYSEVELRQMYFDGEITKSEYDEEVISREMEQ